MSTVHRRWCVILAGGQGIRLLPLTRAICGDDRPKQFCPLFFGQTLLEQTQSRFASVIPPHRTAIVLTEEHRIFYEALLGTAPLYERIEQPRNAGTAAAIALALLTISKRDPDAMILFTPADHHYLSEPAVLETVQRAFDVARDNPGKIVMLGVEAAFPSTAYGWIDHGNQVAARGADCFEVRQFWEKPAPRLAAALFERGCLWNAFVMAGHARAFVRAIESTLPDLFDAMEAAVLHSRETIADLYRGLASADFSREVLPNWAPNLLVMRLRESGWSDLGSPESVIERMSAMGFPIEGTFGLDNETPPRPRQEQTT